MDKQIPSNTVNSLWTADEVCAYLGISRRTLTNLLQRGMPCISISRRILRFNPETIKRWAAGWERVG